MGKELKEGCRKCELKTVCAKSGSRRIEREAAACLAIKLFSDSTKERKDLFGHLQNDGDTIVVSYICERQRWSGREQCFQL